MSSLFSRLLKREQVAPEQSDSAKFPYLDLREVSKLMEHAEKQRRRNPEPVKVQPARETTRHFETGENRYRDECAIGEGGTAIVYKSFDVNLRRPVAVKRFKEGDAVEDSDFVAEMEAVSPIQHPHVIQAYDAGISSTGEFIVMELIKGQDLEQILEGGPLNLREFEDLAVQLLEGLGATHAGGIAHLDIKPSNVMIKVRLSGQLDVTLIDYGKAKLIEHLELNEGPVTKGGLVGSIYYMSPQQLKKKGVTLRCDLYSVGCLFYAALSGKRPFEGDTAIQVMSSHLQHRVTLLHEVAPHLPEALCEWVMQFIEKDPAARPESAADALSQFVLERANFLS